MWDIVKAGLWGKFIGVNSYTTKERSQINDLRFQLKKLRKEKIEDKARRKDIIKIKVETNVIERRKTTEKIKLRAIF